MSTDMWPLQSSLLLLREKQEKCKEGIWEKITQELSGKGDGDGDDEGGGDGDGDSDGSDGDDDDDDCRIPLKQRNWICTRNSKFL